MRFLVCSILALALVPAAGSALDAKGPCAPLAPPRVPLPKAVHVALSDYTFELSANARAHHALCSVGLSSPSDGYDYTVEWDVFPSHSLAVSDLGAVSPNEIYGTIASKTAARGFPAPNYELTGTGRTTGRAVTDLTFVDGTALVSAYVYAKAAFAPVLALAHWASSDLAAIKRG